MPNSDVEAFFRGLNYEPNKLLLVKVVKHLSQEGGTGKVELGSEFRR